MTGTPLRVWRRSSEYVVFPMSVRWKEKKHSVEMKYTDFRRLFGVPIDVGQFVEIQLKSSVLFASDFKK